MCPKVQFSQNTSWKSAAQGTLAEGRCQSYGEGFCRKTRLKAAEILCVFQGFQNAVLRQKIRRKAADFFKSVPQNKKGRGETSPRTQTPFAAAFLAAQRFRRTEPCGPWHGGGREPNGRWKYPFSRGNRERWNGDGGWAGRYASFGTPPSFSFVYARQPPNRLQQSILLTINGHSGVL